jgi:hypothetical protein
VISTVAGNGPPLRTFIQADGLAVDRHDNVYLTDLFHRVCKIDGATGESPGRWSASRAMPCRTA